MNSTLITLAFFFIIINFVLGSDDDPDPRPFEGDIILTKYERDNLGAFLNGTLYTGLTRNAMIPGKSGTLWTGGVVPYTFANGHFREQWKRDVIKKAMDEYQRKTCIRFKWRSNEKNYIHMAEGRGCNSQVGMVGRKWQILNLGRNCINFGTVIHELMHAVGFWHEQSRADRDQYVWIYENNIQTGMGYNFDKYGFNKIQHLGTRYDYCSIMHYPRNAFSANGRDTIVPKQKTNCVLGSKTGFSTTDIYKINKLYNCNGGGTKPTPKPTPTGTCVDDNTSCAGWAQSGECQKNPGWMLKNCRKSCNQCSTTSSNCVDKNTSCQQWASGGHCSKSREYMVANCAKSCNICGTTTTSNCRDKLNKCGSYASEGYCSRPSLKSYMAANCKKSCRFC